MSLKTCIAPPSVLFIKGGVRLLTPLNVGQFVDLKFIVLTALTDWGMRHTNIFFNLHTLMFVPTLTNSGEFSPYSGSDLPPF